MPATQESRLIAIGFTADVGDYELLVTSFSMTEELGRLFHIEVELACEGPPIDFDDVLGTNATLRLELQNGQTRFFNGFVSRFVQATDQGDFARYRATLVPWLWFLTRNADCRIWSGADKIRTVPEILESMFKDVHQFSDFKPRLGNDPPYRKWENCVQYRETDFNFVSRLMEQEGIYYYFTHDDGVHTLVLADGPSSHDPLPAYKDGIISFRPPVEVNGDQVEETITEWMLEKEVQPGVLSLADFNFKTPNAPIVVNANKSRAHDASGYEIYDYPGDYLDRGSGEPCAKLRLQELQARHQLLRGRSSARGLAAGYKFTLKDHPRADLNTDYLITAATYHVGASEYQTSARTGNKEFFTCTLSAIPLAEIYRPARMTPKPLIQGPQTAIVVGKSGEEIDTDEFGRVKVQFHWDRYGKADEKSSCWIRVSQPWAGKSWGAINIPRVGQEVVVEFLDGDPDRPIITGRVYNATTKVPYTLPDEKTKSTLKTNSSKGGDGFNEIRFEDKKDHEQIFIHSQGKMDVRIRKTLHETIYGHREVRVGWEKGDEKGGDHNTLVRNDTNTHVKGGEYREVEKVLNQTVKEDVVEQHQKNHTTMVTETASLNAKKAVVQTSDLISDKSKLITIEASDGTHIRGGDINLEATQNINLKAAQINLEGTQGLSLKCGGSFVVLDPCSLSINGTKVNINSGGSAKSADSTKAATDTEDPDIEEPIEAAPADDGKTGKKTGGAGHPRTRKKIKLKGQKAPPWKPPPAGPPGVCTPPPPPPPPTDTTCSLVEIKAICEHKEGEHHEIRFRTVKQGKTLEVVPTKSLAWDVIELEATVQKCCGSHPEWFVTGRSSKKGVKESFNATGPVTSKFWIPRFSPNEYEVRCETCNGASQVLHVDAYPNNQVTIELDVKKLKKFIELFMKGIDFVAELVAEESHIRILILKAAAAEWGWKEYDDDRAFYAYKIAFAADPIIGWEGKISLGSSRITSIVKKIPGLGKYLQKVIDWVLKFGAYIKPSIGLGAEVRYERKTPDEQEFSKNLGGGVQGKGGIALGVEAAAVGEEVIKVELEAGGEVALICDALIDEKGFGTSVRLEFGGLKGTCIVHLLWGIIDVKEIVQLTDPHRLGPEDIYFHRNDQQE